MKSVKLSMQDYVVIVAATTGFTIAALLLVFALDYGNLMVQPSDLIWLNIRNDILGPVLIGGPTFFYLFSKLRQLALTREALERLAFTDSLTGIVWQTTTIMGGAIAANELRGADVVIRPKLPYVKSWDFTARNDAMLEGERAAQAALPAIKQKLAH